MLEHFEIEKINGEFKYTGKALENYEEKFFKYKAKLDDLYLSNPSLTKAERALQEEKHKNALNQWIIRNSVKQTPSLIYSKDNWMMRLKDNPNEYSDSWKYIQNNEPVKEFYEFYTEKMKDFSQRTGKHINSNFIPNIKADMMESLTTIGVGAAFNMKQHWSDAMKVRQYDHTKGTIDPETGQTIDSIPLMYFDGINITPSKSEYNKIVESMSDFAFKDKSSAEYKDELNKRIARFKRTKAIKYKSKDLLNGLILFGNAVYTNEGLQDTEGMALSLLDYIKTNKTLKVKEDAQGNVVKSKITKKVQQLFNINQDEVELLEKIIKREWYGQVDQSDKLISKKVKDKDGNVIDIHYFSTIKGIRKLKSYMSFKSLSLNPLSAIGNVIGISTNLHYLIKEDGLMSKEAYKEVLKDLRKDRKHFKMVNALINPYTYDMVREQANKLSSRDINKYLTMDNFYIMMKKPDELIDGIIANTLIKTLGVTENGDLVQISKYPNATPVEKLLKESSNGDVKFELTDAQMALLRTKIQSIATKIKGSIPAHNKASYTGNIVAEVLMHFKSWMPGLIETRFKSLEYDENLEELDVGRTKVLVGEIFSKGILQGSINLMNRMLPFYSKRTKGSNKSNRHMAEFVLETLKENDITSYNMMMDDIKARNPELNYSDLRAKAIDEIMDMREGKLKAAISEIRTFLAMGLLMFLLGKADLDDEEDKAMFTMLRLFQLGLSRGYMETSFFYSTDTIDSLMSRPVPIAQAVFGARRVVKNFVQETGYLLDKDPRPTRDKTYFGHYIIKDFVPGGNWITKFNNK